MKEGGTSQEMSKIRNHEINTAVLCAVNPIPRLGLGSGFC